MARILLSTLASQVLVASTVALVTTPSAGRLDLASRSTRPALFCAEQPEATSALLPLRVLEPVLVQVVKRTHAGVAVREVDRDGPPLEGSVYSQEIPCWVGQERLEAGDLLRGFAYRGDGDPDAKVDVCWEQFGHQSLVKGCQVLRDAFLAAAQRSRAIDRLKRVQAG